MRLVSLAVRFFIHPCVICWPPGAVRDSFAAPVDVLAELIIRYACLSANQVAMVLGLHTLRPEVCAESSPAFTGTEI